MSKKSKISDAHSLTLSNIEACVKSIRVNHRDITPSEWDMLDEICETMIKLRQSIVTYKRVTKPFNLKKRDVI